MFVASPNPRLCVSPSSTVLYGRHEECRQMKDLTHRLCKKDTKDGAVQVCLVHGEAGCGKTSLCQSLAKQHPQQQEPRIIPRHERYISRHETENDSDCDYYFVEGKFDQYNHDSSLP